MMEVEGPAIENVYKLFRAEDQFDYTSSITLTTTTRRHAKPSTTRLAIGC